MNSKKRKPTRKAVKFQIFHVGKPTRTREERIFMQRLNIIAGIKVYENIKKQLGAKVYKRFITTNARPWRFRAIGKWLFAFGGRYQTAVLTNIAYGRMATGAGE